MKNRLFLSSIIIVLVLALASCSGAREIQVSLEEFEAEVTRSLVQFGSQADQISEEERTQLRSTILDQIIERKILAAEAAREGFEVAEEELTAQLDQMKQQFPDEQAFQATLDQYGYTLDGLKEEMRQSISIQSYLDEKVISEIEISDVDIQAFYDENPQFFESPESVSASHILISLEPEADEATRNDAYSRMNEVAAKIAEGQDFAELAVEFSEGPSGPTGGDLGSFQRGQMVPEFEEAAFGMEIGDVSDIVETQFGLHIIKVSDKQAAGLIDFEEARESISGYLAGEREQQTVLDKIAALKEKYKIDAPEL